MFASIHSRLFPLRSIVSSWGNVEKLSGGKLFKEFFDKIKVCSEFSNPRKESGSIQEIWLPLRSRCVSFCKWRIALEGISISSLCCSISSHNDLSKPKKESSGMSVIRLCDISSRYKPVNKDVHSFVSHYSDCFMLMLPVACKKYDSSSLNPVFSICNIKALELLIVFGIAGNGTCLHWTIPKSGAGFEHVQSGLKVQGGYLNDSISLARTVDVLFKLANIIRMILAIIKK